MKNLYVKKTMDELVVIHNSLSPEKQATKKTFNSKMKILMKIRALNMRDTFALPEPEKPVVVPKKALKSVDKLFAGTMGRPKGSGFIGLSISILLKKKPHDSYQEILEQFHADHPEVKTSIGCVRWYASKLKKAGEISNVGRKRLYRGKVANDKPMDV